MKILQLVFCCYPGEFRGGVPYVGYHLATAQARLGHEVHVLSFDSHDDARLDVPLDRPVIYDGVHFHYFRTVHRKPARSPEMWAWMEKHAGEFDVIHGHNAFTALNPYARKAAKLHRKPLVFHTHGYLDPVLFGANNWKGVIKRLYFRFFERPNYQSANLLVALHPGEEEQIRAVGLRVSVAVIPNGVPLPEAVSPEEIAEFRQKFEVQPHEKILLYLGRLNAKKGIHVLLEAWAKVQARFPNWRLAIAGNPGQAPAYAAKLRDLESKHGLSSRLIWTGFLNEKEKRGAFGASEVFSHVSQSEGMSISILEAMSHGLPTLVSPHCNMGVAAKAGALVEVPYSTEGVAAGIVSLLSNDDERKRLRNTSIAHIKSHHNWNQIALDTVAAYPVSP